MIKKSRESVARLVGGEADDIIFTSGGTEVHILILFLMWIYETDVCSVV